MKEDYLFNTKTGNFNVDVFNNEVNNKLLVYYRNLKKRGADLILVRMPATDEHWYYDQKETPKEKYWDREENDNF